MPPSHPGKSCQGVTNLPWHTTWQQQQQHIKGNLRFHEDLIVFLHILQSIQFFLLLKSREKDVGHVLLLEVLIPVADEIFAQVVCFVDKKYELLIFAHFTDILF